MTSSFCKCLPGQCSASEEGRKIGRVSVVSDIVCKAGMLSDREVPPDAVGLLDAAAAHMRRRAEIYDQPSGERSMARTVDAFNAITRLELTESQGWLFMELLKAVRDFTTVGGHADSQEDRIAYAALGAEARRAGR